MRQSERVQNVFFLSQNTEGKQILKLPDLQFNRSLKHEAGVSLEPFQSKKKEKN